MNYDKSIQQILTSLDFNEEDAEVYSFFLRNQHSTILECSANTNIERSKTYRIINKLTKANLIKKSGSTFSANKPTELQHQIRHKQNQFDFLNKKLDSLLRDWNDEFSSQSKTITFSTSPKDMISHIYQTLLAEPESEVKVLNIGESFYEFIETDQRDFAIERAKKDIFAKLLASNNNSYLQSNDRLNTALKREVKFLPKQFDNLPMIFFNHDMMLIYNFEKQTVISINDASLASMGNIMFEIIWDSINE